MGTAQSLGSKYGNVFGTYTQVSRNDPKRLRKWWFRGTLIVCLIISIVIVIVNYNKNKKLKNNDPKKVKGYTSFILQFGLFSVISLIIAYLAGFWQEFDTTSDINRREYICKKQHDDINSEAYTACISREQIAQEYDGDGGNVALAGTGGYLLSKILN